MGRHLGNIAEILRIIKEQISTNTLFSILMLVIVFFILRFIGLNNRFVTALCIFLLGMLIGIRIMN